MPQVLELHVLLRQLAIHHIEVAPPTIHKVRHVFMAPDQEPLAELAVQLPALPLPARNAQIPTLQPAPQVMTNFGNVPLGLVFPQDKNAVSGTDFLAMIINHFLPALKFIIKHSARVAQAEHVKQQLEQYRQVILPD